MIASPNGAGKSTPVEYGVVHTATALDLISLNPDVRTRELSLAGPDLEDANLRADIETDAEVALCIERGVDFSGGDRALVR